MTDDIGLTLRERIARHHEAEASALDAEVADLERRLVEHGDLPRIAQALRSGERQDIETRLAALRLDRDRRRQMRSAAAA